MNPFAWIGIIFNLVFYKTVLTILILIFLGFEALHIPGSLGFSIMVLTILIRLLIWPLMSSQLKATKKMAELKPHLDALKTKHKDDKQALAQAQMALYKEHGVNPAGGCLPALIQIPVFFALNNAIRAIVPATGGSIQNINHDLYLHLQLPHTIDPYFFGLALAVKPFEFGKYGIVLLLIPVITALLTFVQSKMMIPAKPLTIYKDDKPKEIKEKEGMEESMMAAQSQMVYFMPLMIGYLALQFPVGLAIYWNTYTILGIIQQYRLGGWGGLSGLVSNFKFKI